MWLSKLVNNLLNSRSISSRKDIRSKNNFTWQFLFLIQKIIPNTIINAKQPFEKLNYPKTPFQNQPEECVPKYPFALFTFPTCEELLNIPTLFTSLSKWWSPVSNYVLLSYFAISLPHILDPNLLWWKKSFLCFAVKLSSNLWHTHLLLMIHEFPDLHTSPCRVCKSIQIHEMSRSLSLHSDPWNFPNIHSFSEHTSLKSFKMSKNV